jgi:hypothetical protein
MKPLVNIDDVETFAAGNGERFEATHGLLSAPLGGQKIGACVTRVAPAPCATETRSFR